MKKYNALCITLLIITAIFFPAWSMEEELTQSRIFEPYDIDLTASIAKPQSAFSTEQKKEKSKTLPFEHHNKESIRLLQQKSIQKKIKSLSDQIKNINNLKQEVYKPIINNISSKLEVSKKLTSNTLYAINYTIKIINDEPINDIIKDLNQQPITLKNKLSILTDLYNLPQPAIYKELESSLYKKSAAPRNPKIIETERKELSSWLAKKEEIATEINKLELQFQDKLNTKLQKETLSLKSLYAYKTILEKSITQLENSKNSDDITKKETYQKLLSTVFNQINLFSQIDKQLQVNYKHFNTETLYDHIELLHNLRQQLHNFSSEQYKKLDTLIKNATSYYFEKKAQKDELVKKELKQAETSITTLMQKINTQPLSQSKDYKSSDQLTKNKEEERAAQEKQQQLEQEEQRILDERIRTEKEKQQRETQEKFNKDREENAKNRREEQEKLYQAELDEVARRLNEEYEQENAKRWIPWITNRFNQTRQIMLNFVDTIRSTANSWWSWLTGK